MTRGTEEIAVRAVGLVKDYIVNWTGRRWRALDRIGFTVARGRICGLVGPNGSGKSTTLKLLAGLTAPTAGRCEINLSPATGDAARPQLGYLPEAPAFSPKFTAREMLTHYARLSGLDRKTAEDCIRIALEQVDLAASAGRRIGEFSKGMRQRLGLAQAILHEPPLLLLDEPASGLDPVGVEQLAGILAGLRRRGVTIVLTSHFLPQAEEWCDDFVLLAEGRVIFTGNREAVTAAGGLHRLYLELMRR